MTYNRIYTKEKWQKVNEYNKSILDDYIMECKAQKKAKSSIDQYYNDARIILIYIMEELDNKPLYKPNKKSFRSIMLWFQENGMSSSRINRLLTTARNLLNFGLDDDEYEEDFEDLKAKPSRIKGMKKESVRTIVFLTDEEVELIYNKLIEEKKYTQALLCAVMYDSACRRNEVYQLKREDFVEGKKFSKNEVKGKRGKKFRVLFHKRSFEAFKLLEETRKDKYETLWLNKQGTPCSYESLYFWVIEWQKYLLNGKKFNAHSFRHSALENYSEGTHYAINKKLDINKLKILAHHKSIDTTNLYLQNKDDELIAEEFDF